MDIPDEYLYAPPDCLIETVRTVDFPRTLVFKAWADPEHLKNWWGPKDFTNTFLEHDLRPGGKWRFVMHAPKGGNFQNECEFVAISAPAHIVWKRHSQPLFRVAATFEEEGAGTIITFRMLFDDPELCRKVAAVAVGANEENMDRLEAELARMDAQSM